MSVGPWFIYNQLNNKLIEGLHLEEVQVVVQALGEENLVGWFVCRAGWKDWQALETVEDVSQWVSRPTNTVLPELPTLEKEDEDDSVIKEIRRVVTSHRLVNDSSETKTPAKVVKMTEIPDVEVEGSTEDFVSREAPRFDVHMRLEIEFKGQVFSTYTVNASVGGANLEDPIPKDLVGYFKAKLISEKTNEEAWVTCSVADNQTPEQRYRVEFAKLPSHDLQELFQEWLQAA